MQPNFKVIAIAITNTDARDADDAMYRTDKSRFLGNEIDVEVAKGSRKTPAEMRGKDVRGGDDRGFGGRGDRNGGGYGYDRGGGSGGYMGGRGGPPGGGYRSNDRYESSYRGGGGGRYMHDRRPPPMRRSPDSRSRSPPPYMRGRSPPLGRSRSPVVRTSVPRRRSRSMSGSV